MCILMGMRVSSYLAFLPLVFLLSACLGMGSQTPAPFSNNGQSAGPGSAGVHNVVEGDTIYKIAQNYRLAMQDIIVVNQLKAPFALKDGQRIKLPPPQEYRVKQGDTIYDVSRLFAVNSSEIARVNNISAPYTLRYGQILRLPSLVRKKQTISNAHAVPLASVKREYLPAPSMHSPPVMISRVITNGSKTIPLPPVKPMQTDTLVLHQAPKSALREEMPRRSSTKFLRPVMGDILSDFGPKKSGLHNDGINIGASKGTSVKAAENGVVVFSGNQLKGSGNLVLIRHEGQWMTAYAHMDDIKVHKGDVVKRGQKIGTVGSTGSVSSPQLHFEVRRGTEAINPKKYIEG